MPAGGDAHEQVHALAQAQEALAYQMQVQKALTENAVSGLLLVDERGHTTYMNPSAVEVLGYSLAELSQMTLHEAVHHSRPDGTPFPAEECPYYEAFFRGDSLRNASEWLIRKDGTFFPASVSATPLYRGSDLVGAVYEFHDITEQHRAWEALREADRRKDQFLAILGHELRNPIATIQNAMEVIARNPSAEGAGRMHSIVLRQAEHLHRLVDDLLDVARIQTGKISLSRSVVDLRDVGRAILDAAQASGRLEGRDVALSIPVEPVWVDGDRSRLEQLLGNLLDNAMNFTPREGSIRIGIERRDDRAVLAVADDGRGLDPSALPRLFQLFGQAEQPLDRPYGGLGVGLSLAGALAQLHGGDVTAESAGLEKGSTFTVNLPIAASLPAASAETTSVRRTSPRRVMIVEDNPDAREALVGLLEEVGHAVESYASGREAVARVHDAPPDIAFIDVGLPDMDGYAVARAIRSNGGVGLRLVALTGYGQAKDVERALTAGFDAHLTKPAGLEQLERAIADLPEGA